MMINENEEILKSPNYSLKQDLKCLNKKSLKRISPLYNKMNNMKMNCDLCEKIVSDKIAQKYDGSDQVFCASCIIKGKEAGYWTKCPKSGHKIFIPIIKKSNNISNNNKSIMDGFVKFQLLEFSKCPSNEWKTSLGGKTWTKSKKIENNCGVGIPCGKINNIVVIDLDDYKWNDDHDFIKTFGRDYTKFGTYTQKSGKGGIHLFFQYDKDLFNKNVSDTSSLEGKGIDILSDIDGVGKYAKKYVVGAGTTIRYSTKDKEKYNLSEDFGTYEILSNKPVIPCPDDLKDWLIKNCYSEEDKTKTTKYKEQKQVQVSNEKGYYEYNIEKDELRRIFKKFLDQEKEYWNSYDRYIVLLTAIKSIGAWWLVKELFDEYSGKEDYKSRVWNKQAQHWNGIKKFNEFNCFNLVLSTIDERTLLDYVKYKPTYSPKITFDKEGEWDKIGKHIKLNTTDDYAIMSGTGTGKTTIVKKDILPNQKFISIVSRRTLAYEQYKVFQEDGIDCLWYEHFEKEFIPSNNSVVIQIDSIMKLAHYKGDISDYTIFLDEYSSLVEHLIRSPTLGGKRALVFKIFTKLIKRAKQVVCVDADLNSYTMKLMDFCERTEMKKLNNTFNHNKGVPCEEYFDLDQMIKVMKSKDKFLCCLDSARLGKAIVEEHFNSVPLKHIDEKTIEIDGKEMNKYEMNIYQDEKGFIVFISAENDFMPNLDEWDRVVFSPKIVYGLDSTMKREVFGIFKEHTISPRGMLQQIARCRDIKKLHYIFFKKKFIEPKFIDVKEVNVRNKKMDQMAVWDEICDEESCSLFMKTLSIMEYNEDCQNTNKFCHFKLLLEERGFEHSKENVFQTKMGVVSTLENAQKKKEVDNFDCSKPIYEKIGEILKIPKDKFEDYCDLFVNNASLQHFLNVRSLITKSGNDIDERLDAKEEFNVLKVRSNEFKILLVEQFQKACGCEDKIDIIPKKDLSEADAKAWMEKFDNSFRFRMKETPNLTKKSDCQMILEKCFKKLYGSNMKKRYYPTEAQIKAKKDIMRFTKTNLFKTERKQINKVRITINKINKDFFESVYNVVKFSSPRLNDFQEFKFGFDENKKTNSKPIDNPFIDDEEHNDLDVGINV